MLFRSQSGSPTWVAGFEHVETTRRGELLEGDGPEALVRALRDRLRALGALGGTPPEPPGLPAAASHTGAPLWVVVEMGRGGPAPITFELLARAATLGAQLAAPVDALVIGPGESYAASLCAAGADRVLIAREPSLDPYTTDAHAAVLAAAITERAPRLVLLGSTLRGRDLAPRVAARLGLGLTGDAIDLDLDGEGCVRQLKPAFGGTVVVPILSRTRPEMATVRPGFLTAARPDPTRPTLIEALPVAAVAERVRVVEQHPLPDADASLDAAQLVLGVGRGVGGPDGVAAVRAVAAQLDAAVVATRDVVDEGWLPRHVQVGLTGRAIAPRLYVALGIGGAMEHMVGLRRAGTIVAINKSPKAQVWKAADLGLVADVHAVLPLLASALRP